MNRSWRGSGRSSHSGTTTEGKVERCLLCDGYALEVIDEECCISRCSECGYIFDSPRPTAAELAAYYSQPGKYDDWLAEEELRDRLWKRRLRKFKPYAKEGSLLDVGTGIGQWLYHAKGEFSSVYGTEVSKSAIKIAKEKYGLYVSEGDLSKIAFPDAAFDNISLFHVLEHVHDPRRLVHKCRQLLGDEGILLIAVPNDVQSLKSHIKGFLGKLGLKRFANLGKINLPKIVLDGSLSEIHLSHFRPSVLEAMLQREGFKVLMSDLDPYYAVGGLKKVVLDCYYAFCLIVRALTGINIYDTIWIVARRINDAAQ